MKPKLTFLALILSVTLFGQTWQPVGNKIKSTWAEEVTPDNVWQEYPRPQMVRQHWQNLNGLWEYAITSNRAEEPKEWNKHILVPFALETPLSGVGQRIKAEEVIWYQRTFEL